MTLLARDGGDGLAQLFGLGQELRKAQQQLRGQALQRLNRQWHQVLTAQTRRARKLARNAGHPLRTEATQQVEQTLGAALADPTATRDMQGRRLVTPLSYTGFGPGVAAAPRSSRPEQDHPARRAASPKHQLAQPCRRERLERELTNARHEIAPPARDAQRGHPDA